MPKTLPARECAPSPALTGVPVSLVQTRFKRASGVVADPAQVIAEGCEALRAQQHCLVNAWQDYEAWLIRHRNWHELSEPQQRLVREAKDFEALHDRLVEIDHMADQLLLKLASTAATSQDGVMAKIKTLLALPSISDDPDAVTLFEGMPDGHRTALAPVRQLASMKGRPLSRAEGAA